jgi:DNA-binding transcriptional regulator YhcF (GntR family)
MRFLTEQQIAAAAAEIVAQQLADDAERLSRRAMATGHIVEMHSVADTFSVVTVRARDVHANANRCTVPA